MDISKANQLKPIQSISPTSTYIGIEKSKGNDFGRFLQEALNQVSEQQNKAEVMTEKFIAGELNDVHSLMIASEKASLGLQLSIQVRNKMLEAYQEMMRMQV
jgi:flagellar hook-basal body complex protein FliE